MKRFIALMLALFIVLGSLAACNKSSDAQSGGDIPTGDVSEDSDAPDTSEGQTGDTENDNDNNNNNDKYSSDNNSSVQSDNGNKADANNTHLLIYAML